LAREATAGAAAAGFAALLLAWLDGGGEEVDLPWAPTLGLRLAFELDGLALLYGLLATGIGLAVVLYSRAYLPAHLAHQGRPRDEEARFYGLLALFMASMVGLAAAQDLVLIFLFWDLTAVASYFLIGYDRQDEKDRHAALMALLVTGVTAVLLLVAVLMLWAEYGTTNVTEVLAALEPTRQTITAAALVAAAALAKSAQAPLHFWLPRAMVAPTPVSAYLHSAALVAAGVFLLSRFHPLLRESSALLDALVLVGLASVAVGGVLALTRDGLKQVLAYSTVAQYGFVVFLLGLGTRAGVVAAAFYVVVHALAKSALFLTAGAVTVATGENRLGQTGGLARSMPGLAVASAVAAAGLVSLPLTAGFFADELLFAAARERGPLAATAVVAGATLTLAYVGRFWIGIFLGPPRGAAARPGLGLVLPVGALAGILLVGGFVPRPLASLALDAADASLRGEGITAAYHLDRAETVLALLVYAAGAALLLLRRYWWAPALAVARLGDRLGPDTLYGLALAKLNAVSDRMHGMEVRDLRTRIAAVLVPAGALVLLGVIVTPTADAYRLGDFGSDDLGLALALGVVALAAIATTLPRRHITLVLVLSGAGFALAVAYAFFGAPNVALVAVLVETMLAVLFLGVLALLPHRVLRREARLRTSGTRRWRDPLVAVISGLVAFAVGWGALSRPPPDRPVVTELIARADLAHAGNVVTAILVDFRGLDTVGEITVLAVTLVGLAVLLRRGDARP
jgi:multicomponent Na+:H+ antiporter subunit A